MAQIQRNFVTVHFAECIVRKEAIQLLRKLMKSDQVFPAVLEGNRYLLLDGHVLLRRANSSGANCPTHSANLVASHHWTPKSELIDALGRTVKTTEHNAHFNGTAHENVVMKYRYDIKGQLLEVTDPLNRVCFSHKYDTAGNNLWTKHLDSGEKTLVVDAQGKPLCSTDAKGAAVYTAYDALHRPTNIWAKDAAAEDVTLRQHLIYGDSAGLTDPHLSNYNGKLYKHYDEAGLAQINAYDFKGNPLSKTRQVIKDEELTGTEKYVVDWDGLNSALLDTREYLTQLFYDGLNRVRLSVLPEEVSDGPIAELPKELVPIYNRAGALQSIAFAGTEHVRHIAYNAKGQRVLMAMGNDMMTRYAYDPITFRLQRIKTERFIEASGTYTPQSGTTKQDTAYEYDLGGNIIKIKERVSECGIVGTPLGANALGNRLTAHKVKDLTLLTPVFIPMTPELEETQGMLITEDEIGNLDAPEEEGLEESPAKQLKRAKSTTADEISPEDPLTGYTPGKQIEMGLD